MQNILIFPGSLRQHSYNRRLAHYFAKVLEGRCHVDMLEATDFSFPLFNQDLESSAELIDQVIQVYERFKQADGIIIASPEYNGNVTPYLKNTIDWISRIPRLRAKYFRQNLFFNKPVLLASTATSNMGGLLGVQNSRPLFVYLGCLVFGGEICVGNAAQRFSEEGDKIDPPLEQYVSRTMNDFLSLVQKMKDVPSVVSESGE